VQLEIGKAGHGAVSCDGHITVPYREQGRDLGFDLRCIAIRNESWGRSSRV